MYLQDLLKQLAHQIGANSAEVALDGHGRCSVILKDGPAITLEETQDQKAAFLSARLCPYPGARERAELFDVLMEAHAFGMATDDAYFGASQAMGSVFLFKRLELEDLQFESFSTKFLSFANIYHFWKGKLDEGLLAAVEAPVADPASSFDPSRLA